MVRRGLLAWEIGDGRGHLTTLKTVAEALRDRFSFDAALCRMDHAGEIAPLCGLAFQGPRLPHDLTYRKAHGNPGTATWGEFMGDTGFRDAPLLIRHVTWWQQVIIERHIDFVVADYAPCALLAARSLDVPAFGIGQGYGLPPAGLERFPVLLEEYSECLYDEAELVAGVNAALSALGVPPLRVLSDVYLSTDQLVRSLPMLDPYVGAREAPYLPPLADLPAASDGSGDEIFVYFSTSEQNNPHLIHAISQLGVPTRVYIPALAPDLAKALAADGVIVETRPVPAAEIARRTRLLVSAGQHGTLCLGLGSGLPQVAFPQQLEQAFHARRAESAGGVRVVGPKQQRAGMGLCEAILEAYHDDTMRRSALALAAEVRPMLSVDVRAAIAGRIAAALGGVETSRPA